jgi:hypothetical protein
VDNDGLQLRRAISIQAEGTKLLEKDAIAPSAARLCWMVRLITAMLLLKQSDMSQGSRRNLMEFVAVHAYHHRPQSSVVRREHSYYSLTDNGFSFTIVKHLLLDNFGRLAFHFLKSCSRRYRTCLPELDSAFHTFSS